MTRSFGIQVLLIPSSDVRVAEGTKLVKMMWNIAYFWSYEKLKEFISKDNPCIYAWHNQISTFFNDKTLLYIWAATRCWALVKTLRKGHYHWLWWEKNVFQSIICHYFIILYHCHTILSILPFGAIKIILNTNLSKTVAEGTFWVTYEVTMFVVLKMTFFGFDVYVMNGNQVRSN